MSDDVIASRPLAYAPTGRKLETPRAARPGDVVFSVGCLTPADKFRVKRARENSTEAAENDFDFNGDHVTDRATGEAYVVARFDPLQSDAPALDGIVGS